MNLAHGKMMIRNARAMDAAQLCAWWNDGAVMAHAGFPNGVGDTVENVREKILLDDDAIRRRYMIEYDGVPIGEMNYRNQGGGVAQIGIKICEISRQEKGLGTAALAVFIDALFTYGGYEKIVLDTNENNARAQHVYEAKLGFSRVGVRQNAFTDQLGVAQASIDYELPKAAWLAGGRQPHGYIHLRNERPADHFAVESLTRDAHWRDNWDMTPQINDTALLVHRIRQSAVYVPSLHFVAEVDGVLAGHIQYCTSQLISDAGNAQEMLTFGPLSVLPEFQGRGVGQALMQLSFAEARNLGYRAVFIFGHADYYPRAGFRRASEFGISDAAGKNFDPFMVYPLYDGALAGISGRLHLDAVYEDLAQEDVDEFDRKFPPKALHVPVSIDLLLAKLTPAAREALAELHGKSLVALQTKSQREVAALPGMDAAAISIIRATMHEHGHIWGEKEVHI